MRRDAAVNDTLFLLGGDGNWLTRSNDPLLLLLLLLLLEANLQNDDVATSMATLMSCPIFFLSFLSPFFIKCSAAKANERRRGPMHLSSMLNRAEALASSFNHVLSAPGRGRSVGAFFLLLLLLLLHSTFEYSINSNATYNSAFLLFRTALYCDLNRIEEEEDDDERSRRIVCPFVRWACRTRVEF